MSERTTEQRSEAARLAAQKISPEVRSERAFRGSQRLTEKQRKERARLAGLSRWSKQDPVEGTRQAREAFANSFLAKVDPELPEAERLRRAECARKAYYSKLRLAQLRAKTSTSVGGDIASPEGKS